jgi:hypothetical protein
VAELGSRGTRAIVVITSGFGELGEEDQRLQQAMLDAAKPHTLRLVGPNRPGIMVPEHGLNASFAQAQALSGDLAFVSQSGAVLTSVLDRATARRIGFSHMVSLGGMADVDCGDMLDYLATDRHTRAQGISTNALQASGQTQNHRLLPTLWSREYDRSRWFGPTVKAYPQAPRANNTDIQRRYPRGERCPPEVTEAELNALRDAELTVIGTAWARSR